MKKFIIYVAAFLLCAAGLSALPFTDARTLRADLRRLLIS